MLTVCIPVFNEDVTSLVQKLYRQAEDLKLAYEIICIDDCSKADFRKVNSQVKQYAAYIQLEQNVGRAKIRNLFPVHARFSYLLYLDSDSEIVSDDFLNKYITAIRSGMEMIVCGGHIYTTHRPDLKNRLRWVYGNSRESKKLSERRLNPHRFFKTCNFIIHKSVFDRVRFEERLIHYGHEDTLFAFQLKKNGVGVSHIDNPVFYKDVESNKAFLQKTESGLRNLVFILKFVENDLSFFEEVSILSFYKKCKKSHLTGLTMLIYFFTKPILRFLLSRGFVFLSFFDFYKLGYLTKLLNDRR